MFALTSLISITETNLSEGLNVRSEAPSFRLIVQLIRYKLHFAHSPIPLLSVTN
jgi:hypothetical protein